MTSVFSKYDDDEKNWMTSFIARKQELVFGKWNNSLITSDSTLFFTLSLRNIFERIEKYFPNREIISDKQLIKTGSMIMRSSQGRPLLNHIFYSN